MIEESVAVIIANLLPTGEQVVGIPTGILLGLDPIYVFLLSLTVNTLLFFPVYFGLKLFYDNFFSKINLFNKYLERTRKKGKPYVDRYGIWGLALFISFPTPFTGTYTASMVSWLIGLDWKKSVLAIFVGSAVGGLIILVSTLGLLEIFKMAFVS